MIDVRLTINGKEVQVPEGSTILEAARSLEIYIPALCTHPDLPPAKGVQAAKVIFQGDLQIENARPGEPAQGCGLCVVEVGGEGEIVESCSSEAKEGMVVNTESDRVEKRRQEKLVPILSRHPHSCLTCAQQEGCSISQCSSNVPENERCCNQFGHCELQDVANYVGISDATPKWLPTDLPVLKDDPLFEKDYNLCIGCLRCVRACRDLRGIEALGFVYDKEGKVQVGYLGPDPEVSGCKFCTACVEVCPTGALIDKAVRPGKKEEDIAPCREACPAHVDVPEYLRLIAAGRADEANSVIRERVPLPGILGRVCIHPCEEVCRRGEVNEPVSICALKRYAADNEKGQWKGNSSVADSTGKKVAIVGAGPAGLTAAFYLKKKRHDVTLFDSRDKPGGMMRYGIPCYRLPSEILDKEIGDILDPGIQFRPGQKLGDDFTLKSLEDDGYNAIFLGIGAQNSRRIMIEGSGLPDVLWGVDFLRELAEGKDVRLKDRVVVVGGGNVAIDAALSALRCGAKEVTTACLESHEQMPAHEWEIVGALEEGVKLMPSWGPRRVLGENDEKVTGIELVKCTSVFDAQGNFMPTFDDDIKEVVEADQVIMAIGQASDLVFLGDETRIVVDRGLITVREDSLETGWKGVYAGGDVAKVPGAIIHAIAAGRKAAESIDKALGGTGEIREVLFERTAPDQNIGRDEGFAGWPREKAPELALDQRQGFDEISLGYPDDHAVKEAKRCLQCDLRLYMGCNPSPPSKWLAFTYENISQIPEEEGVYQLFDEEHNIIAIKGTANLLNSLMQEMDDNEKAAFFEYEEDKMFSKRESELIQQYLQEHGEMPGGGDDDLF